MRRHIHWFSFDLSNYKRGKQSWVNHYASLLLHIMCFKCPQCRLQCVQTFFGVSKWTTNYVLRKQNEVIFGAQIIIYVSADIVQGAWLSFMSRCFTMSAINIHFNQLGRVESLTMIVQISIITMIITYINSFNYVYTHSMLYFFQNSVTCVSNLY